MEPMTLGSPPNGSTGYGSVPGQQQQQSGPQYLPGFLMGDISSQSGGRSFQTSPMKMMKGPSTSGYLSVSPPGSVSAPTPKATRLASKPDKPGGPPVQRLFSAPGTSAPSTPSDLTRVASPHAGFTRGATLDQSDQFDDSDTGTWVTVFGFPPSATSYILTQTGMWGHILEHRMPSQGNWMHLKFANRLQARKALARNGRLLTDSMIIGVVPCVDQTLVEDTRKENMININSTPSVNRVTSTPHQPLNWTDRTGSFAMSNTSLTPTKLDRSNLRPLTQAFKGAQADYEVSQQRATPQQNTSLVSKAMDFVFGW